MEADVLNSIPMFDKVLSYLCENKRKSSELQDKIINKFCIVTIKHISQCLQIHADLYRRLMNEMIYLYFQDLEKTQIQI